MLGRIEAGGAQARHCIPVRQTPDGRSLVSKHGPHHGAHSFGVGRTACFGIGALLAQAKLLRQQILHRFAQQPLFDAAHGFDPPRHIIDIAHQSVVAQRREHLKPLAAAHAHGPLLQIRHEKVKAEPLQPEERLFLRALHSFHIVAVQRFMQPFPHIGSRMQLLPDFSAQYALPQLHGTRPGEGVFGRAYFSPEPGIAAEHLVSALAGDHRRRMPQDFPGKEHQRAVNIRHAGKAPVGYSPFKPRCKGVLSEHYLAVPGAEDAGGKAYVERIPLRAEGVGDKILLIAIVIHRKAVDPADAHAQERRQCSGIHAAGEHAGRMQVHHIPHRPFQQEAHMLRRIRLVIIDRRGFKAEVALLFHAALAADEHAARLQAPDVLKRRFARRARRAEAKELAHALPVHYRRSKACLEQIIRVTGKHQLVLPQGIKQALLAHSVPRNDHAVSRHICNRAHAGPFNVLRISAAPLLIGPHCHKGRRCIGWTIQLPRQGASIAHVAADHGHDILLRCSFKAGDGHMTLAGARCVAKARRARKSLRMVCTEIIHGITLPLYAMPPCRKTCGA